MDLSGYRHRDDVVVERPAEEVYALVADITRMGEWSPVCTGGTWDDDRRWFTGSNAIGDLRWATRCRVEVADPGREFTFVNHGPDGSVELVRWGFHLSPAPGGGTLLAQTWQVLDTYADLLRSRRPDATDADLAQQIDGMQALAVSGMADTLAAVKRAAEAAPAG